MTFVGWRKYSLSMTSSCFWRDKLFTCPPLNLTMQKILCSKGTFLFFSGKDELVYVRGGVADLRETDAVFTFKRLLRFKLTEVKLTEPK